MIRPVGAVGRIAGVLALAAVALVVRPAAASAQRFAIELGAGAAIGTYSESGAGLETVPGPAFEALLQAALTESVAAYAGFSRASFGCDEGFCTDRDVTFTSQGLVVGARWSQGLPWVRAGLALQALDVDARSASESADVGLGWDLGAGLEVGVSGVRFRPGLVYRRHRAETGLGGGHVAILLAQVGVAIGLGGR